MQNVPSFDELSVGKLYNHFKSNKTIMKYMPDYSEKELPEKEFFFGVLATLYPVESRKIIDAAYKARNTHYQKNQADLIELTKEAKDELESVVPTRVTLAIVRCV